MTEENYLYRTSPLTLRNQFPGSGRWHIPTIPKAHFADEEFQDLRLIGYDRTKPDDERHLDRMVHFFLYDYKFGEGRQRCVNAKKQQQLTMSFSHRNR